VRRNMQARISRLEQRCGPTTRPYDPAARERALAKVRAIVERYEAQHPLSEAEQGDTAPPGRRRPPLDEWSLAERFTRACGHSLQVLQATLASRGQSL
jgi:hypothetical protein